MTCECGFELLGLMAIVEDQGFFISCDPALHTRATAFIHHKSLMLYFNVRFLISFASLQIFDVIFDVLTDLVQSNPSLDRKEVWYIMCIDPVRCLVPISLPGGATSGPQNTLPCSPVFFSVDKCGCLHVYIHIIHIHMSI